MQVGSCGRGLRLGAAAENELFDDSWVTWTHDQADRILGFYRPRAWRAAYLEVACNVEHASSGARLIGSPEVLAEQLRVAVMRPVDHVLR